MGPVLTALSDLGLPELTKVLRRTVLSALVVGAGAVVVALVLSQPWAAVGLAAGVAVAIVNLRFLDAGVAKVKNTGQTNSKVLRRLLGTRTATRLAVITAVAIGLLVLDGPLGIGFVTGLVLFQILFVVNVGRVLLGAGVGG